MAILGYKNSGLSTRAVGLDEWLKTRGLAGWLEIATDGLEDQARQRIGDEIGVHYAEAVTAHLAAGEPEFSAQALALAELGDPQVAARSFQSNHLMESEVKAMRWQERTAARPLLSFRMLPYDIAPVAGAVLVCYNPWQISHLWLLVMGALMDYTGFRLIPRLLYARMLPRTSFLKWLALSNLLGGAAFSAVCSLFFYMRKHDVFEVFFLFLCTFLLPYSTKLNSPLWTWNKLRKMGHARNDMTPKQPTAN